MKAVYEMPKVRFEAFMANDAVSSCTPTTGDVVGLDLEFDCLRGGEADPANVLNNTLFSGGCTNSIGFADYNGQYTDATNDNITQIKVEGSTDSSISNNHSTNNTSLDWITTGSGKRKKTTGVTLKDESNSSFMGWLYLSANANKTEYSTEGWSIVNGILKFLNNSSAYHAMLVPIFAPLSLVSTSA